MTASSHSVTQKWLSRHAERLPLYVLPTPNGLGVTIMLAETGLADEPRW
ncbi:MAG: hypothetical protein H7224_00680 [Polaromonas sp.]|nr:hypothetical protein [Polaromonas sp.]